MTVSPGFGHHQFLRARLAKIRRAREMIDQMLFSALEVDGGTDTAMAPLAVTAGADVLVAARQFLMPTQELPSQGKGCGRLQLRE